MLFKDVVLLHLADKEEKQEVYTRFSSKGKADDFIEALFQLNKKGLIYVPRRAWAWGGYNRLIPEDVVMTGVKLTPLGLIQVERLTFKNRKSL
ncbi:hypothetical protein SAMN05428987_5247 [Paenibacillus sp. CF095]|uniref:hypothetical protein n=1 Tax=Paenibacillus sp. CF095 TaxID=1881033 RepID=UPI000882FC7E|nr:hypothetical protein [Paenibacillus sp. CF095]SDD54965.1 hypothetical protein SAMN05428987_5247 [Paenibacillus sp. CF095]